MTFHNRIFVVFVFDKISKGMLGNLRKSWGNIFNDYIFENGLDWQCCLAGSSKTAPRIFIFSIVLGAENLSYVKSIETHARAFLPLNISAIGSVVIKKKI